METAVAESEQSPQVSVDTHANNFPPLPAFLRYSGTGIAKSKQSNSPPHSPE